MKKLTGFALIAVLFLVVLQGFPALAALIDRGDGFIYDGPHRFIYDDQLDITIYDYTYSTAVTWTEAENWVNSLEVYDPVSGYTIDDWRLPDTYDPIGNSHVYGYDGTDTYNYGYNITSSELGHLFYEEFEGTGLIDIYGMENNKTGVKSTRPFDDFQLGGFWSTTFAGMPNYAFMFQFANGYQQTFRKSGLGGVIAVRDGDVLGYTQPPANMPPILDPINNVRAMPGSLVELSLSASDPDPGDIITFTAQEPLPPGASFDPATAIFSWLPVAGQEGNYPVEFSVFDNGSPIGLDVQVIIITIGDISSAPQMTPIAPKTVGEYTQLTFRVEATDPDGDAVSLSATSLPGGASFDNASGLFTWRPNNFQVGRHTITFTAAENYHTSLSSQMDVFVTVQDIVSPSAFADAIMDVVIHNEFSVETEDDYLTRLQKVKQHILKSHYNPALNTINFFIDQLENDMAGGLIPQEAGDTLISMANELTSLLTDDFPEDPRELLDSDGDGVGDNSDLCPDFDDSLDTDGDGVPDGCDLFSDDSSEWNDSDSDQVGDKGDNCPTVFNPGQIDDDSDTKGNVCDPTPDSAEYGTVVDAPHNQTWGISCSDCHDYSLWWGYSPTSKSGPLFEPLANTVCRKCHSNSGNGRGQQINWIHSSIAMGALHNYDLGEWQLQCVDCHDPHMQAQLDWITMDRNSLFLIEGTIDGNFRINGGLTLFDYTADTVIPEWEDRAAWGRKNLFSPASGLILVDDAVTGANTYEIISADTGTIIVKGGLNPASAGNSFGVIYGQLIKSQISTSLPETRDVKFFNPLDPAGGFTDTSDPVTGICQVCHVNTLYWNSTGILSDQFAHTGFGQFTCTDCHMPGQGFQPTP